MDSSGALPISFVELLGALPDGVVVVTTAPFAPTTSPLGGGVRSMSSRLDIVLLHSDGREIPVDVALCTIPYADDRLIVATVRDASNRRRVELDVERERARFSARCTTYRARYSRPAMRTTRSTS